MFTLAGPTCMHTWAELRLLPLSRGALKIPYVSVLSYLELSIRPMLLAFPYCVSNYFCTLHDADDIVACIVRNTSWHMGAKHPINIFKNSNF
jgi:hypothetical protein